MEISDKREIELIETYRKQLEIKQQEKEKCFVTLTIAKEYYKFLLETKDNYSFNNFVNEFGYKNEDSKEVYLKIKNIFKCLQGDLL